MIASDSAIGSGDILVASEVPSYRKAGCCRCWRGCSRRLTKEKTTWSLVTPLFLIVAITRRMISTCLPPGPLLDQLSWTWGATRGAMDDKGSRKLWIWSWWRPGVKKFKTLAVTERVLWSPMAILWITWKINGFYRFRKVFYHLLCREFSLFLKSKLKYLNSRLEGCGICVLEIYFLNFVGNNEEKGLKWPSAWFCDST